MEKKDSVLLVDDDHTGIMALTHMLRPEYTVYVAKNGQEAIEAAQELIPDIVLLDIIMPDMDGYAVLGKLNEDDRTRNIPVIFVTGSNDTESEEKGLSLGAVDYIVKPYSPVIVRLRVGNQIKLIRQMRLLMEKEIEEKNKNARIDTFLNMSYEMLTPVNTIMGMIHTAKMSGSIEIMNNCLDNMESSSSQLLQLIKRLLSE